MTALCHPPARAQPMPWHVQSSTMRRRCEALWHNTFKWKGGGTVNQLKTKRKRVKMFNLRVFKVMKRWLVTRCTLSSSSFKCSTMLIMLFCKLSLNVSQLPTAAPRPANREKALARSAAFSCKRKEKTKNAWPNGKVLREKNAKKCKNKDLFKAGSHFQQQLGQHPNQQRRLRNGHQPIQRRNRLTRQLVLSRKWKGKATPMLA